MWGFRPVVRTRHHEERVALIEMCGFRSEPSGIGSMGRDEGIMAFVFRFAFQVLINFTIGLVGALVAFIWYLWGLVKSYQPDPVTAVISFFLFTIAASSMVFTYLLALYGETRNPEP
jgi:hypothetical protein